LSARACGFDSHLEHFIMIKIDGSHEAWLIYADYLEDQDNPLCYQIRQELEEEITTWMYDYPSIGVGGFGLDIGVGGDCFSVGGGTYRVGGCGGGFDVGGGTYRVGGSYGYAGV
jgi:hypothetical protein